MGISTIFDLSSRSLGVYQKALNATANNIANVDNENYSRQRVIFETERSVLKADGEWGMGVKLQDIERVRDRLTDIQIRSYNSKYSNNSTRSSILGQIETQFSEPDEQGLSNLMSSFFSSWSQLSVTPNSDQLRTSVIQSAQKMTAKFQSLYEGISQINSDVQLELTEKVSDLNSIVSEIHTLNQQIMSSKVSGSEGNELQDERDKCIDELSKLANINVNTDSSGSVSISIGGVFAVDGYNYSQFKVNSEASGKTYVTTDDGAAKLALNGGSIYALTDLRTNVIPSYLDDIDSVANHLMDQINSIHSQGYTTDVPPETGISFFSSYNSGVLKINDAILNDTKKIAASSNGESGNGDVALNISKAADNEVMNGKTIGEFYSQLVSDLGTEKQLNDQSAESNQLVLTQLDEIKGNISGVSTDEEMTNVIKFQRSYEAAAKVVQIADDMLQTLLNMV